MDGPYWYQKGGLYIWDTPHEVSLAGLHPHVLPGRHLYAILLIDYQHSGMIIAKKKMEFCLWTRFLVITCMSMAADATV